MSDGRGPIDHHRTRRARSPTRENEPAARRAPPASKALYERALQHACRMGVGSSFQARRPVPDLPPRGPGQPASWDVDGNEYVDFHNGFGCMVVGHAHPKVAEAIERAARTGTHFAAPTEATVLLRRGALRALRRSSRCASQLGHRGDDERDPRRARRDRAATTS